MVDSYTQDTRLGELTTPIGTNKLVLNSFVGQEGISEPFRFEVAAISETNNAIDFDKALGENITIKIASINGDDRYFTGTLTEAVYMGPLHDGHLYNLVLRPWFWLLSKQIRSQVFHELTVREIVAKIIEDHGQSENYQDRLERGYPSIEYCVQHRETDFAFVSRLLEAHGIGYFFEFADGKQTLVVADTPTSYPTAPKTKRKVAVVEFVGRDEERFYEWFPSRHFATDTFERNDYDFRQPHANMRSESSGNAGYSHKSLRDYGHPFHQALGKSISESEGKAHADSAVNAEQSTDRMALGYGDCVTLAPGMRVLVEDFPDAGASHEYLVLRATHEFFGNAYRPGSDNRNSYQGSVETLSTRQDFAPPRLTPRPRITGPQTGRVVGDDEIETDEFGRIRVFFHWMLEAENTPEGRSMWCRVAQIWSGREWGGQFIPRKGMEVLVQFIDGDPDQPVIVGTLYNGENDHPFKVPADNDISGWRSHSVNGGYDNYNEISMKDTSGAELLKLHAERDLLTEVEAAEKREVGTDRETKIGTNDTLEVGKELMVTAGTRITLKVGASKIVIDGTSITLTSPTVKIDAAHIDAQGSTLAEFKSPGQVIIKGGFVLIN